MKKIIVLMVVLLSILCTTAAVADEPLFVAKDGLKHGYINAQGEWVIEPRFNQAWPFTSAGYAAVVETVYDPWAYRDPFTLIDKQGNIVAELPDWSLYISLSLGLRPMVSISTSSASAVCSSAS